MYHARKIRTAYGLLIKVLHDGINKVYIKKGLEKLIEPAEKGNIRASNILLMAEENGYEIPKSNPKVL